MTTLRTRGRRVLVDILIELREGAGLTQRELANALKRPAKSYVDRVESYDQIPDPLECRAWAEACGVTGWSLRWRLETRLKQHP